MRRFLVAGLITLFAATVGAETLTASCKEPKGRMLGVLGELGQHKTVDKPDWMAGGVVTISWKVGSSTAKVVTDTGEGKSLHSSDGVLAFESAEQVSFVVVYPGAVYLYSVFPKARKLLMSSHQLFLGFDPGSAVSKSFVAPCDISMQ